MNQLSIAIVVARDQQSSEISTILALTDPDIEPIFDSVANVVSRTAFGRATTFKFPGFFWQVSSALTFVSQ